MRRLIVIALLLTATLAATAQQQIDFAEKFLSVCRDDTTVHCVTVSPRMMLQMMRHAGEGRSEQTLAAVSKLKSMRIVTATADHYDSALELLSSHRRRFTEQHSWHTDSIEGSMFTRKNRRGETVELVMLKRTEQPAEMMIVCLTGSIDEDFMRSLR